MNARRAILLAAAALVLAAAPSPARVFMARGRRGNATDLAFRLGWTVAYQANMELANGPAEVTVYGDARSLEAALRGLEAYYRSLGAPAAFLPGGDLGWGLADLDGRVVRYLVLSPREGMGTLVYRIDQSRADVEKLRAGQTRRRLDGLPDPVAGRPGLYVRDPDRRIGLDMARTRLDPQAAAAQADAAMRADGWVAPLPPAGGATLYVRRGETVVISCTAQGRETVVTRVHRQGGARTE